MVLGDSVCGFLRLKRMVSVQFPCVLLPVGFLPSAFPTGEIQMVSGFLIVEIVAAV